VNIPDFWKNLTQWPEYFGSEEKKANTQKMMLGLEEIAKELGGSIA